jgi:RNA polymerase sigma factor (sigma-70 family)
MLHHPQDAEDATQEILIKVLTRLSSFEGRSSFRTWLYRIVVNHVLNMKRGRVEVQHESIDFAAYGAALDATPDLELADLKATSAETDLLVTEEMLFKSRVLASVVLSVGSRVLRRDCREIVAECCAVLWGVF